MANLAKEGFELEVQGKATIDTPHVYHCGDIMYDNSLYFAALSKEKSPLLEQLRLTPEQYILCTIHRDSNTDNPIALQAIFEALLTLIDQTGLNVVLPIHPRTKNKIETLLSVAFQERIAAQDKLQITAPAGFLDMIALEQNARLIVTDSGGVKKEAYFFAKPCVILREQTEWVEVVEAGAAILTGANQEKILNAATLLLNRPIQTRADIFGNGHAATFICQKILTAL